MQGIFTVVFALGVGALLLRLNKLEGNPAHLSVKGRRILFVSAIIVSAVVYQCSINLYYTCDQKGCGYSWGDPLTKGK